MSAEIETPKPSSRDESSDSGSDSDASSGAESSVEDEPKVEWLATGREKRSTAGNRMKTMMAMEEPDSDLELLFAEDEDDVGFEDADGSGSDVHMDSSSDDEDEQNAADSLEGEEALEREARERRAAARKRKAQAAIPAKFRKKVRIDTGSPASASASATPTPSATGPASSAPPARPRKKSERLSWLPLPSDAPTRASQRSTTRMSKEQLHMQMKEREARRLQQVALMEKRQRQMEARKKPPMTQAERLEEAALVEKRNAKSLNRWEEAEKQREEQMRAKLAALNSRTLKGPVITFWSGRGDWEDGRSGDGGAYHIAIADKPKPVRKKRVTAAEKEEGKEKKDDDASPPAPASASKPADTTDKGQAEPVSKPAVDEAQVQKEVTPAESKDQPAVPLASTITAPSSSTTSGLHAPSLREDPPTKSEPRAPLMAPPSLEPKLVPVEGAKPRPLAALPAIATPSGPQSSVLAAPVLAPPAGLSPTVLGGGFSAPSSPKSHVLAPPNTTQRPSPLSLPPSLTATETQAVTAKTPDSGPTIPAPESEASKPTKVPPENRSDPTPPAQPGSAPPADAPKEGEDQKPSEGTDGTRTRCAIILENFDDTIIKDKVIQTQILFGRKMSRLQKPLPQPLCAITNQPARYRDPKTGLPYHNAYAYREIRRLTAGEFRWSALLGCWVGKADADAAKGVPARFLDPEAPAPEPRPKEEGKAEGAKEGAKETKEGAKEAKEGAKEAKEGATGAKEGAPGSKVDASTGAKAQAKPGEGTAPPSQGTADPSPKAPEEAKLDKQKQSKEGVVENAPPKEVGALSPADAPLPAPVPAGS
ncbi:uncharacterized protein DNG_07205 [Cephalotrichum gorgonifer]|uniref:Vps72/YL1 C-terminal domain-containing protein n=1 Tax=Cephalotrichum gorgonifer TaxID=2041049 RepID=A0AAE8N173_9PEZI|nr:uncharacterized protein DNG_07205 [Cephalotrichum gorgonifer]